MFLVVTEVYVVCFLPSTAYGKSMDDVSHPNFYAKIKAPKVNVRFRNSIET
jgi:hypothetical protein